MPTVTLAGAADDHQLHIDVVKLDGMSRILLVYYSQSGEVRRVSEALAEGLACSQIELTIRILQLRTPYPFPWKRIGTFFGVLPECHWGPLPALHPLGLDSAQRFDLVILVYQVWFLAPSLPIQAFLKSKEADLLKNTKVLTVSVSRKMWQSASETMRQLLRDCGAIHIDNVVLTDQAGNWTSLVTTPRAMLFGRRDGFWKIFPPVGIDQKNLDRVRYFGRVIADQREQLHTPEDRSLLRGLEAVKIDARSLLAERVGWYSFRGLGFLILTLGKRGAMCRRVGVYGFVVFLVCALPIVIPTATVGSIVFRPLLRHWMDSYSRRLREPSERADGR